MLNELELEMIAFNFRLNLLSVLIPWQRLSPRTICHWSVEVMWYENLAGNTHAILFALIVSSSSPRGKIIFTFICHVWITERKWYRYIEVISLRSCEMYSLILFCFSLRTFRRCCRREDYQWRIQNLEKEHTVFVRFGDDPCIGMAKPYCTMATWRYKVSACDF